MGMFLKIVGVLALIWFGIAAVGCGILVKGVSSSGLGTAIREARDQKLLIEALQDGKVDIEHLPADIETASLSTIPLRDGTSLILRDSPGERAVRGMLAMRMRGASQSYSGSTSYYERSREVHFKPGEPMVNPNPGGRYGN